MNRLINCFSANVTKLFLLSVFTIALMACERNNPSQAFVGTWEPVGYEECDIFVITSDSIKAITCDTKEEHLQSHYTMLNDSIAKLERTWLMSPDISSDLFYAEVPMYIDNEGYLIIKNFHIVGELFHVYPNYTHLKLRKVN